LHKAWKVLIISSAKILFWNVSFWKILVIGLGRTNLLKIGYKNLNQLTAKGAKILRKERKELNAVFVK